MTATDNSLVSSGFNGSPSALISSAAIQEARQGFHFHDIHGNPAPEHTSHMLPSEEWILYHA